jgi:hypothetical protein
MSPRQQTSSAAWAQETEADFQKMATATGGSCQRLDVNDAEKGVRNLTDCVTLAILRDMAAGANKDVAKVEESYYRVCWSPQCTFLLTSRHARPSSSIHMSSESINDQS